MRTAQRLRFGEFDFEPEQRLLLCKGEVISLSPKVLQTLELLLEARGGVVLKDEFMRALWPDTFVEEGNLTQNIFILRKTLGLTQAGQPYLATISKRGYRLTTPVELVHATNATPTPAPVPEASTQPTFAQPDLGAADLPPSKQPAHGVGLEVRPDLVVSETAAKSWMRPAVLAMVLACGLTAVGAAMALRLAGRGAPTIQVLEMKRLTNDGMPKNLGPFPSPLVSDGQRLYFTEKRDNQSLLADVAITGGEVSSQPAPVPDAAVVDYSKQTHELLLGSIWHTDDGRPILSQRDDDKSVRQIGELTGHEASWSPGGDKIALAHGRFLQVANTDGSNVRSIVTANGVVYWPRWSPDGRLIRFTESYSGNRSEIWEVGVDGRDLHQVLGSNPGAEQACCGNWSGDGRSFFYLVSGPASSSIWVLPYRTFIGKVRDPKPTRLTVGTEDVWRSPLPSADGRHLWAIASHGRGELVGVDAKTRELRPYLRGMSAEGVSFSPDRNWIAYTAYPEGTLWRSHPDGTHRVQITQPPQVARFPRWSPDGETIAFMAGEAGSDWRLYLASVPTSTIRPLSEDDTSQGVASWSPDGRKIAFGRLLDFGTAGNPNLTIEIFDLETKSRSTVHGSSGLWTPRWSPDGRYIAAVTEDNRALRLFDMQTQQWSELAHVGVNDVVWSPDSQFVYFDTVFGADPMLYRVHIADRRLEPWADLKGLHRGGFFSPWLGMTPEGSPILLRDTAIEEVYQLSLSSPR